MLMRVEASIKVSYQSVGVALDMSAMKGKPNGALPCQVVYFIRTDVCKSLQKAAEIIEGKRFNADILTNAQDLQILEGSD